MSLLYINFNFLDLLDIVLVAYIIYQVYYLIRGTVAIKIFFGILAIYLLWKLVTALQMEMLGELLGQFIGVGVIALLIVFQQELRQFLLFIGDTNLINKKNNKLLSKLFPFSTQETQRDYSKVVNACVRMAESKTGALIVISNTSDPMALISSFETLEAKISEPLLLSIFQKYSPLHDGAIVIKNDQILVARAILPVSSSKELKGRFGTRHRAALGLSEKIDAYIIIVSEETGHISLAYNGTIQMEIQPDELKQILATKP